MPYDTITTFGLQHPLPDLKRHPKKVSKMNLYKKAINRCCSPICDFGYGLHCHHIIPLAKGGEDVYSNYIVLCVKCHGQRGNHRLSRQREIELSVYKFYIERLELGFCSDEMSNEEFEMKLRRFVNDRKVNCTT